MHLAWAAQQSWDRDAGEPGAENVSLGDQAPPVICHIELWMGEGCSFPLFPSPLQSVARGRAGP